MNLRVCVCACVCVCVCVFGGGELDYVPEWMKNSCFSDGCMEVQ